MYISKNEFEKWKACAHQQSNRHNYVQMNKSKTQKNERMNEREKKTIFGFCTREAKSVQIHTESNEIRILRDWTETTTAAERCVQVYSSYILQNISPKAAECYCGQSATTTILSVFSAILISFFSSFLFKKKYDKLFFPTLFFRYFAIAASTFLQFFVCFFATTCRVNKIVFCHNIFFGLPNELNNRMGK